MTLTRINYNKITELIFDMEEKYCLFDMEEDGVFLWKLMRVPLMMEITKVMNNISSIHGVNTLKQKRMSLASFFIKSFIYNPFIIRKNTSKLVFENPRKLNYDNQKIDPYTHFLLQSMESYHVIDGVYKLEHLKSIHSPASSTHLLILLINLKKMLSSKKRLSKENIKVLKKVESDIEEVIGVKISIVQIATIQLNNFINSYFIYDLLFKNKRLSEVYMVCSYGKEHIIAAAKKNNIKVVEIQHGIMGPLHLGYHFPNFNNPPYFPNEILTFGEFWSETTSLPNKVKCSNYGYPFLLEEVKKLRYKIENKNQRYITIVSQGTIGKDLASLVLTVAKELKEYQFLYKLHPGEFDRWKDEYPDLNELNNLKNVKVFENEKDLNEMFAISSFAIGVYSTALFESVAFKCSPLIVNLPGVEYMEDFCELFELKTHQTSKELVESIRNNYFRKEIYNSKKVDYLWSSKF